MMGHHHKLISGDEYDILTGARKLYKYTERPGVCRKVKTRANRRYRRTAKRECYEADLTPIFNDEERSERIAKHIARLTNDWNE